MQKKTAFKILEKVIMSKKNYVDNQAQTDELSFYHPCDDKMSDL